MPELRLRPSSSLACRAKPSLRQTLSASPACACSAPRGPIRLLAGGELLRAHDRHVRETQEAEPARLCLDARRRLELRQLDVEERALALQLGAARFEALHLVVVGGHAGDLAEVHDG